MLHMLFVSTLFAIQTVLVIQNCARASLVSLCTSMDAPVAWRSCQQKTVSLSSCESEHHAITEAAQELLHLCQLFQFLKIEIVLPMVIKCDNQGAVFLARNESSTRTKHVDVRHHFIRDLVEQGIIQLEHVNTKENAADMLTKNLPAEQFEKLIGDLFFWRLEDFLLSLESSMCFREFGKLIDVKKEGCQSV